VEIIPVTSRSDLDAFIDLPWRIYAGNDQWVPPLKSQVRHILDRTKHPFWQFADQALFLAKQGAKVVGRIAGIVDRNSNAYRRERCAAWGFFECEDDPAAANALFDAVAAWARQRDMEFLRGPLNPSTNYECALLVEGFDTPPVIMMPYNHPYYVDLIQACGFAKEKDLFMLHADRDDQAAERMERLARRIKKKTNIWIRQGSKKNFEGEMSLVGDIYRSAWADNWGFVPMTEQELREMGKELVQVIEEQFVFFLYYEGEAVGVMMMLPDINPLLKRLNGRIGVRGLYHYLFHRNDIKGLRAILFGIKKPYQRLGLPLVAFNHLVHLVRDQSKYEYVEFGWTLEDNDNVNSFLIHGGAKIRNRYRIFRRSV
jgi:hypothetical protein